MQDLDDSESNGRVAFVGGAIFLIAAVIWILLLSGCANPARQVFPNESIKKGMNAL